MAAPQLGGLHFNFTINPGDILNLTGLGLLVASFVVFLIFGYIVKHGIKIGVAVIILGVVLYFVSGIAPSFSSFGTQLWSMLSVYIPSMITLATGLLPLSGVTAAAGFATGFLGFEASSPIGGD